MKIIDLYRNGPLGWGLLIVMAFGVLGIVIAITSIGGCVSSPSPIAEMMTLVARGEKACVRNGVVVRGDACASTSGSKY